MLGAAPEELMHNVVFAGVGLAVFIILVALILVIIYAKRIYEKLPPLAKKALLVLKKKLMYNSVLRYATQKYLSTAFQTLFSIAAYTTLSIFAKISVPLTVVYLILLPAAIYYWLRRNFAKLGDN